jgi:lipoprotein NlpI
MMNEAPIPMQVQRNFLNELNLFIEYCNDFYNIKSGMYPIAKRSEIINAIGEYLTEPHPFEIQFDSIDREKVREILEPNYNYAGVSGGITLAPGISFGPAIEFTVCEQ